MAAYNGEIDELETKCAFPDHLAVDDGLFETLVQRIHWLLGEKVEIETYAKEDGMHIVLKDMDYGMDGELFNMKEEDE